MFMLVNKKQYVSCTNDVEMWVLKEKKTIFLTRIIESYSRSIKVFNYINKSNEKVTKESTKK